MYLPEVEVVGLHVPEGFRQMGESPFLVPRVGLARQEDLVPALTQCTPVVVLTPGVSPGRFQVVDAEVDGAVDECIGLTVVAEGPEHPFAAEAEDGGLVAGFSEGPRGQIHGKILSQDRVVVKIGIPALVAIDFRGNRTHCVLR